MTFTKVKQPFSKKNKPFSKKNKPFSKKNKRFSKVNKRFSKVNKRFSKKKHLGIVNANVAGVDVIFLDKSGNVLVIHLIVNYDTIVRDATKLLEEFNSQYKTDKLTYTKQIVITDAEILMSDNEIATTINATKYNVIDDTQKQHLFTFADYFSYFYKKKTIDYNLFNFKDYKPKTTPKTTLKSLLPIKHHITPVIFENAYASAVSTAKGNGFMRIENTQRFKKGGSASIHNLAQIYESLLDNECLIVIFTNRAFTDTYDINYKKIQKSILQETNEQEIIPYDFCPCAHYNFRPSKKYTLINIPSENNKLFYLETSQFTDNIYFFINNGNSTFFKKRENEVPSYELTGPEKTFIKVKYTWKWDTIINGILRYGNADELQRIEPFRFTENALNPARNFTDGWNIFTQEIPISPASHEDRVNYLKVNGVTHSNNLKTLFYTKSKLITNPTLTYRGMKQFYKNEKGEPLKIGDSIIIQNFMSTSKLESQAVKFGINDNSESADTDTINIIYYCNLKPGVVYIDLSNTDLSYFEEEAEICLAPKLMVTVTNIITDYAIIGKVFTKVEIDIVQIDIAEFEAARSNMYMERIVYTPINPNSPDSHNPVISNMIKDIQTIKHGREREQGIDREIRIEREEQVRHESEASLAEKHQVVIAEEMFVYHGGLLDIDYAVSEDNNEHSELNWDQTDAEYQTAKEWEDRLNANMTTVVNQIMEEFNQWIIVQFDLFNRDNIDYMIHMDANILYEMSKYYDMLQPINRSFVDSLESNCWTLEQRALVSEVIGYYFDNLNEKAHDIMEWFRNIINNQYTENQHKWA